MPIQTGYNRYVCDGSCGTRKYILPDTVEAQKFVTRTYVDANLQTVSVTLCNDCAAKWDTILAQHDADFTAFLANGTVPDRGDA